MNRNSLLEMSGRAMHQAVRLTLNKGNDSPMMQELNFDGMNSDGRKIVERVQSFGMSSVPLPRQAQKLMGALGGLAGGGAGGLAGMAGKIMGAVGGGAGGAGGVGQLMEKMKGPAAEGIALFLGGQRNHPTVIALDDRRFRPMGMKPGESAQYDDQGQMTLLRRNGLFLVSLDDSGNDPKAMGFDANNGVQKDRMVSLRHVEKKKEERGNVGQGGEGGNEGMTPTQYAEVQKKRQNYKHEGETVNTEIRATKNKIEILDGTTVVAVYDKSAKSWTFTAQSKITIRCEGGPTEIWGKPIKFNGGGNASDPFEVKG